MTIHTELPVRVTKVTAVGDAIKRFRLERLDGGPMPIFSGGAHVVVSMDDHGKLRRNPYSLMSHPDDTSGYEISVLRVPQSRGGSHFLHDHVSEGHELTVSQPVNLFPADRRGRKHILFAGGIGITPFIAMMAQFSRENAHFELHYAMRSRAHGAYWQLLLDTYGPDRIKLYFDDEKNFIPAARIFAHQPLGTHSYVCGPQGMIEWIMATGRAEGWPKENLHFERFLAPPPGRSFDVTLSRSMKVVTVGEHQSILEAAEAAGIDAPYMCRGGACGQCETGVSACDGRLVHNDIYLTEEEKASGARIMICVSRFEGKSLILDL